MSVKTYSLKKDGSKQLSPHFRVREFRCKDGSDRILIESALVDVLEKVYDHFGCSRINITSGYRTPSHDKKVGGRGYGAHTEGKAADFIAYSESGSPIPSREVSLYLEDIGVNGIGYRCGGNANATHTDVDYRRKTWHGDEKKSMTASVGSFYKYLGVCYRENMAISNVSIRREPSKTAERLAILALGSKIKVSDCMKIKRDLLTWYKVLYEGSHAYVAGRYLKEVSA